MRKNKTGLPAGLCWTVDRHGKRRLRFFGRDFSTYFREPFGSPEFAAEYAAALARNQTLPVRQPIGAARTIPGSISALVVSYFELVLPLKAEDTQAQRRALLNRFRDEHGHRSVAGATPELLETIILQKAKKTPHGANDLRKALRDLFKHAVRIRLRPDNPMLGIERIKTKKGGRRRWSDDELARYRARWPNGTQQRVCFELALETTARRGNVAMLGPQHERPPTAEAPFGWLAVAHIKGSDAAMIPITAELRAAIAAMPIRHLTYLHTRSGKPRSAKALTGDFRSWCNDAGLASDSTLHGLRHTGAHLLAEAEATTRQIMAVTGHRTLALVEHYTRDAEKAKLAAQAMAKRSKGRAG
jgi:integrase